MVYATVNHGFGIWKPDFMRVFKIGQRSFLFGCPQSGLARLANHVRHAAFKFHSRPKSENGADYKLVLPPK
jgi:hypothetical protein